MTVKAEILTPQFDSYVGDFNRFPGRSVRLHSEPKNHLVYWLDYEDEDQRRKFEVPNKFDVISSRSSWGDPEADVNSVSGRATEVIIVSGNELSLQIQRWYRGEAQNTQQRPLTGDGINNDLLIVRFPLPNNRDVQALLRWERDTITKRLQNVAQGAVERVLLVGAPAAR